MFFRKYLLSTLIWIIYKSLYFTWRVRHHEPPELKKTLADKSKPIIFAHFHGDEILSINTLFLPFLKNPKTGKNIVIHDVASDTFMQQILLRPAEFSVIATLNLNGDYISDALAAQVGSVGIAPGANLSDSTALFESTHGTLSKYAGKDYVNPGSAILAAEMMLRHMGWLEAADIIIASMEKSIASKKVTYDFARLMDGATQVSCSGFGEVMITNM